MMSNSGESNQERTARETTLLASLEIQLRKTKEELTQTLSQLGIQNNQIQEQKKEINSLKAERTKIYKEKTDIVDANMKLREQIAEFKVTKNYQEQTIQSLEKKIEDLKTAEKKKTVIAAIISTFGTTAVGVGTNIITTTSSNVSGWILFGFGCLLNILSILLSFVF